MKEIRSALMVGTGAIGAAIASRIFCVDPGAVAVGASGSRRQRYARDGFLVNGTQYRYRLADSGTDGYYDLILIAVKNYDLDAAIEEIRPFVGPETTILSLLNGITSEEILRKEFGEERVPLAFVIGIDALREKGEVTFLNIGEIRFGREKNLEGSNEPRIEALKKFFTAHNVPYSVPEDMVRAMWYKFMLNVALNQWSAVLDAPYGFFMTSESAKELLRRTMEEVVGLSSVCATGLVPADMDTVFATLAKLDPAGKTSMHQDVSARRKTEVEAFAGVVAEKSRARGRATPINETLYLAIKSIEESHGLKS